MDHDAGEAKMHAEQRLWEAAQNYLGVTGQKQATVLYPGARSTFFIVMGNRDDLPEMLHAVSGQLRGLP